MRNNIKQKPASTPSHYRVSTIEVRPVIHPAETLKVFIQLPLANAEREEVLFVNAVQEMAKAYLGPESNGRGHKRNGKVGELL